MTSRLPFDALRTFAEIARGLSAAEAAGRLNVSPGAVSQRIAALEAHLGDRLVERRGRHLVPTSVGLALFERVRPHLEAVEAALTADRAEPVMRLHATPAFADAWLMPRLAALVALVAPRPLELVTAATPFERTRRWTAADIAIRYGGRFSEELAATPLVAAQIALVAADGPAGGDPAAHLRERPLICQTGLDEWPAWLERFGVPAAAVRWGPRVSDDAASLRAAELGHGIASVRACTVGERARLRVLARRPAPGNATYHLVTRRADLASPPIRRLHAWAGAPG
ncbi:LysR family transcriptional regulator [Aquibium sp. A9E412]|uniref:LysR family transcriptional regulator n=1 Tax=Aquibium sp. A9E412 TaxID=2976767 RepID=UPI0025B23255|nr:LysR family transcriptional regulator [Aquibium sp. A9E412]MDN2567308.1 LysR family transcriptional regulator [Aquibium sp. A9E412]